MFIGRFASEFNFLLIALILLSAFFQLQKQRFRASIKFA